MLQLSKAHTELPSEVMALQVIMDPHSHSTKMRKVHSTGHACVQATAWSAARWVCRRKDTFVFTGTQADPTDESWFGDTFPVPPYPSSQGSTHQHLVVAVGCGCHGNPLVGA